MATVETVMASQAGPSIMSSQAGQPTLQRGTYNLTAAEAGDNTLVIRAVRLPAQHRITRLVLATGDLDSGAGITLNVGIEDTEGATTDATLLASADTTGQSGGLVDLTNLAALELAPTDNDRYITVAVQAAAAGGQDGNVVVLLEAVPELGVAFDGNA